MADSTISDAKGSFAIEIDYQPGRDAPSRVFRALSDMIEAVERAHRMLVRSLAVNVMPALLLEDIEKGSIRGWFRSVVQDLPDKTLESGEFRAGDGALLQSRPNAQFFLGSIDVPRFD